MNGALLFSSPQTKYKHMLKENKAEKLTPHDKKVERFLRIKGHAMELLPFMLAASYPGLRESLKVAQNKNDQEMARSIQEIGYEQICLNAFQLAEKFAKVSKNQRGKWISED